MIDVFLYCVCRGSLCNLRHGTGKPPKTNIRVRRRTLHTVTALPPLRNRFTAEECRGVLGKQLNFAWCT